MTGRKRAGRGKDGDLGLPTNSQEHFGCIFRSSAKARLKSSTLAELNST